MSDKWTITDAPMPTYADGDKIAAHVRALLKASRDSRLEETEAAWREARAIADLAHLAVEGLWARERGEA